MLFSEIIEELGNGSYTDVFEDSEMIYSVSLTGSVIVQFYPYNCDLLIDEERIELNYSDLSRFYIEKDSSGSGLEFYFDDRLLYSSITKVDENAGFFSSLFSSVKSGVTKFLHDDTIQQFVKVSQKYFKNDDKCTPSYEVFRACKELNWEFPKDFYRPLYTFVLTYKNQLNQFKKHLRSKYTNCLWAFVADNTYKATAGNIADTVVNGFLNYLDDDDDDDSRFGKILSDGGNKVLKKASEEGEEYMLLLLNNGIYFLNPNNKEPIMLDASNLNFEEDENIKGAIDVYYTEDDKNYLILDNVSQDLLSIFADKYDDLTDNPVEIDNTDPELLEYDNTQRNENDDEEDDDETPTEEESAPSSASDDTSEIEAKLTKLKTLFEKGLISEDDYNAKKTALLSEL